MLTLPVPQSGRDPPRPFMHVIVQYPSICKPITCKKLHVNGMMTAEQLRAARAMLKMEQAELAQLSGVSLETIKRLERMDGELAANSRTLSSIESALQQEGVLFLPENGG